VKRSIYRLDAISSRTAEKGEKVHRRDCKSCSPWSDRPGQVSPGLYKFTGVGGTSGDVVADTPGSASQASLAKEIPPIALDSTNNPPF